MENNENTAFEKVYENVVFEKVYNECTQRLNEVSQKSFWIKLADGKSGSDYAQAFLNLLKVGNDTPINLEGTLNPTRYKFGDSTVSGAHYFGSSREFNTFLIEKVYEEMLLAHGRKYQRAILAFIKDFMIKLSEGGIKFAAPHFVDYSVIAA